MLGGPEEPAVAAASPRPADRRSDESSTSRWLCPPSQQRLCSSSGLGRPAPVSALTLGPLTRLTSDSGLTTEPSVSADGRFIAYASNRGGDNLDIYVQQTSGGPAIRLTNDPADDRQPTLSPDGSFVAFRSDRIPAGIYLAPALGGSARLIAPEGRGPRFSPDGQSIAYWTGPWLAPQFGRHRSTGVRHGRNWRSTDPPRRGIVGRRRSRVGAGWTRAC